MEVIVVRGGRWVGWLVLVGCTAGDGGGLDTDDTGATGAPGPTGAAAIAPQLGVDRWLGDAQIVDETTEGAVTTWTFSDRRRARCMRGDTFRVGTRDAGSDDLVIFLQGGGACWSEFCLAVTGARGGLPGIDVLRDDLAANPVADWNMMHVPYCDGSLFTGDVDVDEDGDGAPDRFHRGLANISAALDVATVAFPSPRRVLLVGASGGAFGAMLNAPLVRHVYPDSELFVFADSGVGVFRGAEDPGLPQRLVDEFELESFVPDDCPDCLTDGHLTPIIDWYLQRDTEVRLAVFSSWYDAILGDIFLDIPPASFRDATRDETARLASAYPDRYRRFLVDGRMHTTLLGDATGIIGDDLGAVEIPPEALSVLTTIEIGSIDETEVDGTTVGAWLGAFVDGDDQVWRELVEEPGPVPGAEDDTADR